MLVSHHPTATAFTIERPADIESARAEAERLIGLRRLNFIRREPDGAMQMLASILHDRSVRSGRGFAKHQTDDGALADAIRAVTNAGEYKAFEWVR